MLTVLQELRAPIFALRAFNVETAMIGDAAKNEMMLLMRCQASVLVPKGSDRESAPLRVLQGHRFQVVMRIIRASEARLR